MKVKKLPEVYSPEDWHRACREYFEELKKDLTAWENSWDPIGRVRIPIVKRINAGEDQEALHPS
jgi:hypothetical protein